MNRYKLFIFVVMIMSSLPACARTVIYHEYEPVVEEIEGLGKVKVFVRGTYVNHDKYFLIKKTIYGPPYYLVISFVPFTDKRLCISRISITQGGNTKVIHAGEILCDERDHGKAAPLGYQAYGFENVDLKSDNAVRVDIQYHDQDSGGSGDISVLLANKPVRKEKRSDLLDLIGSQ